VRSPLRFRWTNETNDAPWPAAEPTVYPTVQMSKAVMKAQAGSLKRPVV
jgi:hypothetical protein